MTVSTAVLKTKDMLMTPAFQAHSLGAFRGCCHGDAIAYTATLEATGEHAVHALLGRLREAGLCLPHEAFSGDMNDQAAAGSRDYYAVLDIKDTDGNWLDNLAVPTKSEFDQLREALSLRIESSDCDLGCE
ncbi:hypothetical protein ACP6C3_30940 [Mycolicibacterium septicum]|uniref:Uncharacterized protein n=1 Tax=Mycolicibacterium septicum TaxID=98668 RepID=A0ABW9M4N0_9MYCO